MLEQDFQSVAESTIIERRPHPARELFDFDFFHYVLSPVALIVSIKASCTEMERQLSGIGSYDVLCGRHKLAFNNIGNRRLRVTVSLSIERYLAKMSRHDKTLVIISIVELIQESGGRFLKWNKDRWIELGEKQAREKVGHALRDMLASARDLLLSSSASLLSAKKDFISQSSIYSTRRSNVLMCQQQQQKQTNMFKKNDSAVESSAHFGCDVYFPAPLELCFERDFSDGRF
jgi:hypothetical protein